VKQVAARVATLGQALGNRASEKISGLRDYQQSLIRQLDAWGIAHGSARFQTAEASLDLAFSLTQGSASDRIAALAGARIETSAAAMGTVMARATALSQSLHSPQWAVLDLVRRRAQSDARAKAVTEAMIAALNDDEHVTALEQQLSTQHRLALELMEQPVPSPPAVVVPSTPSTTAPSSIPGIHQVHRRSVGVSAESRP
jgi:hypothetical protein